MTSHEGPQRRDLRPAEAASSSDADSEHAERLYGCGTPMPDKLEPGEWEPYTMRKQNGGTQSAWGVLRNDRTPLNTPCTPAVVKLQLRREGEYANGNEAPSPTCALVTSIRTGVSHLMLPMQYVRSVLDRVITRLLPRVIEQSTFFERQRGWIVWYLTSLFCIPCLLLLSPMAIALCIFTSPVWIAGGIVLVIRACVLPSSKAPALELGEEYVHSHSPHHRVNGTRGVNGVSAVNLRRHHHHSPVSYRRTSPVSNGIGEG